MALSKYDDSDGVSVRDDAEAAAEGMPSKAASVDSAAVEVAATSAEAFKLTLLL